MQQDKEKMLPNPEKIFAAKPERVMTPAREVQDIVCAAVGFRRLDGIDRATHYAARELGISQSRVVQILRGKVARVWADEWLKAKAWYAAECERQAIRSAQEAEIYKARSEALRASLSK